MNELTAQKRSCLLPIVLFLSCLRFSLLTAQTVPPDMEVYVKLAPRVLTLQTRQPIATSALQLINLYDSPLVAASWDYTCRRAVSSDIPGHQTEVARHRGTFDAAETYAHAITAGLSAHTFEPATECRGGITALIFADGKEIGDPDALSNIHGCRAVGKEELDRRLQDETFTTPAASWDPELAISKIQERLGALNERLDGEREHDLVVEQDCRRAALLYLTSHVKAFQQTSKKDATYPSQVTDFLTGLQEWSTLLTAPEYNPKHLPWWAPSHPLQ